LYEGLLWDNIDTNWKDPYLESEIARFTSIVREPESTTRSLTPLWVWLLVRRFSRSFIRRCLWPALAAVDVDSQYQSAQSVLDYFKGSNRLLGIRPEGTPYTGVDVIAGGSGKMWRRVAEDIGTRHFSPDHQVTKVSRDGKTWTLHFDGKSDARAFSDVVVALPLESARNLHVDGGDMRTNFLLKEVPVKTSYMTLHSDANAVDKAFGEHGLYLEDLDRGYSTYRIGRIFGDAESTLLLTVHDSEDALGKHVDPAKVIKEISRKQNVISIWDELFARPLMAWFNGGNGIHVAGDWMVGSGKEDGIRAGVFAACKAGLPKEPPKPNRLYTQLISLCYN
jgi:predicted NAD/FAD-binding protein